MQNATRNHVQRLLILTFRLNRTSGSVLSGLPAPIARLLSPPSMHLSEVEIEERSIRTIDVMSREEKGDTGINMTFNLFTCRSGPCSQTCSLDDLPLQ